MFFVAAYIAFLTGVTLDGKKPFSPVGFFDKTPVAEPVIALFAMRNAILIEGDQGIIGFRL